MGRSPKSDIYIDGEKIYVYIGSAQIWAVSAFWAVGSLESGIWLVNGPFYQNMGKSAIRQLISKALVTLRCKIDRFYTVV